MWQNDTTLVNSKNWIYNVFPALEGMLEQVYMW